MGFVLFDLLDYTSPVPVYALTFTPAQSGLPLDRALADLLSLALGREVGRSWVRKLLTQRRFTAGKSRPLGLQERAQTGWVVRIEFDANEAMAGASRPAFDPSQSVLYRDEHWLALDKPAGLLVHPGADKSQPDMVTAVAAWLGDASWTLHHRLDRETSGLVLLSLSDVGRASVAAQFENREVEKSYLCRVAPFTGKPTWSCSKPLGERRGRVWVDERDPLAKAAHTEFRRLGPHGLVEARPKTGRKHQIRVHLACQGRPILGDVLYDGPPAPRLMLHAHRLTLRHPDGDLRTLEAPAPREF